MDFCFESFGVGWGWGGRLLWLLNSSFWRKQTSRVELLRHPGKHTTMTHNDVYFVWSSLSTLQIRAWRRENLATALHQRRQNQSLSLPNDIHFLVPNALTGRWIPEHQIKGNVKSVTKCLNAAIWAAPPTPTENPQVLASYWHHQDKARLRLFFL